MAQTQLEKKLQNLCEPIIENLGLELVEVHYGKENGQRILRLTIDGPKGVSHKECEVVSRAVEGPLDELDPIPDSYLLQVSSPGLDRPIITREHYEKFIGEAVHIRTYQPLDGVRNFKGTLLGLDGEDVVLNISGKQVKVPLDKISRGRLDPRY